MQSRAAGSATPLASPAPHSLSNGVVSVYYEIPRQDWFVGKNLNASLLCLIITHHVNQKSKLCFWVLKSKILFFSTSTTTHAPFTYLHMRYGLLFRTRTYATDHRLVEIALLEPKISRLFLKDYWCCCFLKLIYKQNRN